MDAQDANNFE